MTDLLPSDNGTFPPPLGLGRSLRRWRALKRMKQSGAAEFFGVTQSTISRWEAGIHDMGPAEYAKVEAALAAPMDPASETALSRLVGESPRPVHLVCDLTHRLLACSTARAVEFSMPLSEILGQSLWRYASPAIQEAEEELQNNGWRYQPLAGHVEFDTDENRSDEIRIVASRCRWTRLVLPDGVAVRLVETID